MNSNNLPLVAVSGLGRGESPQPGPAIIASLRRCWPDARIAGLVYDALESGIYMDHGPEAVFTLPYPSCGGRVLLQRIDEIRQHFPFQLLIPTLDLEIELLITIVPELKARGIQVMIPSAKAFKARTKINLPIIADQSNVLTPRTIAVQSPKDAAEWTHLLGGKAIIKGPFYDATRADSPTQAQSIASRILAEWGGPILVQELIVGDEYDVLAVGNGQGETLGSCSIKKLVVSSRGKGYAGITVNDESLNQASKSLMETLKWRGPWECEFIRNRTGQFYLIEINPRFPAWADFPSALGANLVAQSVLQVLGIEAKNVAFQVRPVPVGKVFLRHSTDLVCDAEVFRKLAVEGNSLRQPSVTLDPIN